MWPPYEHKNLHIENEKNIHIKLWIFWGKWLRAQFETANYLALIVHFKFYYKWVQRGKYPN